jgi:hypothetical protein
MGRWAATNGPNNLVSGLGLSPMWAKDTLYLQLSVKNYQNKQRFTNLDVICFNQTDYSFPLDDQTSQTHCTRTIYLLERSIRARESDYDTCKVNSYLDRLEIRVSLPFVLRVLLEREREGERVD